MNNLHRKVATYLVLRTTAANLHQLIHILTAVAYCDDCQKSFTISLEGSWRACPRSDANSAKIQKQKSLGENNMSVQQSTDCTI